jgi:hypothetical protein
MNQDQYTLGTLFEQTGCIAQDVLIKYVDGQLSKADARKVEMHIVDCALCDAALEGVQAVGTKEFAQMVARVDERVQAHQDAQEQEQDNVIQFRPTIHPPAAQRKTKSFLPYFGIAASIVLLAVLGFIFWGGGNPSSVADSYFQEHSISGTRSVMGDTPTDTVTPAEAKMTAAEAGYDAKDYKTAAKLFDEVGTPYATFQAANSYYRCAQYDLAVERYKAVTATSTTWKEYAELNLAMTYLKLDRVADAKVALESIVANPKHNFHKQAVKALDDVNGL